MTKSPLPIRDGHLRRRAKKTPRMADYVLLYLLKFLGFYILFLGLTGNTLSLLVLCRKSIRTSKIGPYLIALNIADIFALNLCVIFEILKLYGINIEEFPLPICRMAYFFFVLASQSSSWLTVIITVERMLCICRPLTILQRSIRPLTVVFAMVVVLAILDIAFVFFFTEADGLCKPLLSQQFIFIAFLYSYVPSFLLVVCNSVIVYKLYHRPALGQTPRSGAASGNMVRVVLAINIVFILTTLPVSLLINIRGRIEGFGIILADFISCLNNVSNFLLYVLFGKTFRKELKSLFRPNE